MWILMNWFPLSVNNTEGTVAIVAVSSLIKLLSLRHGFHILEETETLLFYNKIMLENLENVNYKRNSAVDAGM